MNTVSVFIVTGTGVPEFKLRQLSGLIKFHIFRNRPLHGPVQAEKPLSCPFGNATFKLFFLYFFAGSYGVKAKGKYI